MADSTIWPIEPTSSSGGAARSAWAKPTSSANRVGFQPVIHRSPTTTAGTLAIPSSCSVAMADGSLATSRASNSMPRLESRAFVIAQLLHPGRVNTRIRCMVSSRLVLGVLCGWRPQAPATAFEQPAALDVDDVVAVVAKVGRRHDTTLDILSNEEGFEAYARVVAVEDEIGHPVLRTAAGLRWRTAAQLAKGDELLPPTHESAVLAVEDAVGDEGVGDTHAVTRVNCPVVARDQLANLEAIRERHW